jgi:hypothetical protein
MKMMLKFIATMILVILAVPWIRAQNTTFTYQGRLDHNGDPANGVYDLRFTLHDDPTNALVLAGPLTNSAVPISNGVFVAALDFGSGPFKGDPRWLEISVRTQSTGSFILLSPRQRLAPAPYSIFADSARSLMDGGGFVGLVSGSAVEIRANGQRALRIEPNMTSPNIIGGSVVNAVNTGVAGATIGGGGASTLAGANALNRITDDFGVIGGGAANQAGNGDGNTTNAPFATVGGGYRNIAGGIEATISGGTSNRSFGLGATIGGGGNQTNNGSWSTIAGGRENQICCVNLEYSGIGGGRQNQVLGSYSVIAGGQSNLNLGDYNSLGGGLQNSAWGPWASIGGGRSNSAGIFGTVAGGINNLIVGNYGSIGGGWRNIMEIGADSSTIAGGEWNQIEFYAFAGTIGGGVFNRIATNGAFSTVAGGVNNWIEQDTERSAIGGGENNVIQTGVHYGTIAGGRQNFITSNGYYGTIGGGTSNIVGAVGASIPGGSLNEAGGDYSFAAGYRANALHSGTFVWADSLDRDFTSSAANQFLIRASGGLGIGTSSPRGAVHVLSEANPTVVRIQSTGGPGFGRVEFISDPQGSPNEWRPAYLQSTDNGGFTGGLAFFVNGTGDLNKFGNVEVMRLVNGRVGIGTTTPGERLHVVGNIFATGTITPNSDRNVKKNFRNVDPDEVLSRVLGLRVQEWSYRHEEDSVRHMGPMAQDFHAAFGLGANDKTIATVDSDGVALAAIQGLNRKLQDQLAARDAEIHELKNAVAELKQLLTSKKE